MNNGTVMNIVNIKQVDFYFVEVSQNGTRPPQTG